ncbi:PREDICTED: protein NLP6-like isoform X2 [Nicotiana attenuata]|uniref:protein NLP6-like isoform X2 n=1 Tax=Nicotiana attenuata TaxID=49451 RepID=UPI00090478CE|nr:PREDICTED: protein NLP6-like isoform X2 [Nicotiana attenuata]
MEGIEKSQLPVNDDVVYEVYTSSEFKNYMGESLSCSEERSNFHLMVFWSNNETESNFPHNLTETCTVKQKIKAALQRIETSQVILLQFWGLEKIEGRDFLTTSGQPFGLRYLYKGLCWYRKHCQGYKYSVNNKGESAEQGTKKVHLFGPPARVFQEKLPESSTHVGYYTNQEFPMRDHAVRCGVRTYLALPVFEPIGKNCVGVIELVTVWKGGYLTYEVEKVLNALEGVDLKCPKLYLRKGRKVQAGKQSEREEIKRMLKIVRETHKLPFVRVWIPYEEMDANDHVYDDYYYDDMLCFRDISKLQPLQKDQGVVGKAFFSGKLCYCENITEFSIIEYPLVHYACWCGLTSSFAICLKSGDEVYILELFLPPDNGDPKILLGSILSTMGQHFQSFKFASGQELGHDSSVQVIKASSDKNVDYFHIYQTRESPFMPEVLPGEERRNRLTEGNANHMEKEATFECTVRNSVDNGQLQTVQSDVLNTDLQVILEKQCVSVTHLQKESRTRSKDFVNYDDLKQHFNKNLSDAAESLQVSRSTLKRLCRKYGIRRWPSSKRKKTLGESDCQPLNMLPKKKKAMTSAVTSTHATHGNSSSSITVKATYGEDMMKFKLYSFSRKEDLDKELAKRLQLPVGKFRIKYMDEDNDYIWIACDDDLSDCFNNAQSLGKNTIKMLVLPAAINYSLEL